MKVVHISTYDSGGAAIAAIRLHEGLLNLNVDSSILVSIKRKSNVQKLVLCKRRNRRATFFQKILNNIGFPQTTEQKDWWVLKKLLQSDYSKFGKSTELKLFYSPTSSFDITNHDLVRNADIIHLHWVSGFLDYTTFFKTVKKPIVWTLHDKGVVLGGFHLLSDYNRSSENWKKISAKYQQIKINSIGQNSNITIVSPSNELLDFSKQSYLGKFNHYHIFNPIDTKRYIHKDMKKIEKTTFLVVGDMFFYHKGFDIVLNSLKSLSTENFEILIIGNVNPEYLEGNSRLKFIGSVEEEEKLIEYFNKADAVLIPSREDNLPNVMLEALSCGTPVICTPVGGMLDVIENGINGLISTDMTPQSFAQVLDLFIKTKDKFDPIKIREKAISLFSIEAQAKKYLDIYQQIAN